MPEPGLSTTPPPAAGRRRVPAVVVIGLVAVGLVVGAALLLQGLAARSIPELTETALVTAESRWGERGPADYDMEIEIQGAQPGIVRVEVRNGEVVAMERNGMTPRQSRTWVYWSVPGRFEEIERELEMAADPEHEMQTAAGTQIELRCAFDAEFGYPREFHRITYGGGTEVYWRVKKFQPK